jgi:carbonic anhydrase/acetyltransferase-like protein (isoleucine patch superfamily)
MELAAVNPPALATQPETPNEPIVVKKKITRAPKHDFKDGNGRVFAHRHDNGRGWVADTASVADTVYVGSRCQVFNFAKLTDSVRLEGGAQAYGHCRISGGVTLKKLARVAGNANVRDTVIVHDSAVVTDRATVDGDSQLFGNFSVAGHAVINTSRLDGTGRISGDAYIVRSRVSGNVTINGRAIVIHGTIAGRVSVQGFAQILNSTLNAQYFGNVADIIVTDYAVVADGSRIMVPIEIKNHAVVVRSQFSGYSNEWVAQGRLLFGDNLVANNRTCNRRQEIENLIAGRNPNGQSIVQATAMTMLGQARAPVQVAPVQRRLMRVQEASA